MRGVETRRIEARGVSLAVLEAGSGGTPLLVLHGLCGAKENFAEIMEPLAEGGWHVVVPDQRGHGETGGPAGDLGYSFEIYADDALGLADALGWDRLVLLGHSMGGMTAQFVAIGHPERLIALVLMDTSHGPLDIDPELAAAGREIVSSGGMAALVKAMSAGDDPLATEAHRRLLAERPGYQEMIDSQNLAASPRMWLAMSEQILTAPDRLLELGTLALPTLVVVGEQDGTFLEPSRRMASSIEGASLEVVPRAGHSPQLESPEAWLAAVLGFLGTVT